jgi:hypothetical protein
MTGRSAEATTVRLSGVTDLVLEEFPEDLVEPLSFVTLGRGVGFEPEETLDRIETLIQSAQTFTLSPLTCEEIEIAFTLVLPTPQLKVRGEAMATVAPNGIERTMANKTTAATIGLDITADIVEE